ncbi:helix-turn-helix transcriptional regulator [Halovenus rubra]|uniref:Helix-turn-helix transcriptional regulator n=2 Tax=Halovenus rubra TaxID=869890 RepID=A0ACC7E1L5_9EURY|nr:winged helix-turn-helix domain-containing protein [Halovenus rubra]
MGAISSEKRSTETVSSDAVEAISFLVRSEHRVRVLAQLQTGDCSREQLNEVLDVSRVTLSRVLGDLEEREWIRKSPSDHRYRLTSFGERIFGDLSRLMQTVSVGQQYPDIIKRLPAEWFGFDLRCLTEGEHIAGNDADPLAAARVVADEIQHGSTCRSLLGTFIALPMYTFEASLQTGTEPTTTVMFDPDLTESMLTDQSLLNRWQSIEAKSEKLVYYSVETPIPCSIDLIDESTVFLTVEQEGGSGFDIIKSTHPDVIRWAKDTIDDHYVAATPLKQCADDNSGLSVTCET